MCWLQLSCGVHVFRQVLARATKKSVLSMGEEHLSDDLEGFRLNDPCVAMMAQAGVHGHCECLQVGVFVHPVVDPYAILMVIFWALR